MVNFEDAECIPMTVVPTKEWDDIPYPRIVFYQTSSQEIFRMEAKIDEAQESFLHINLNSNIIRVIYTIMAATVESKY